ncbi:MAG: diversity-generating retroelement protein Avd [Anaerolineae bacterium]|nr:diversity-generating retroelement protein Avd [Anaerolineae bacterium]
MQARQSPIFTKTYDLLKWLLPHLDKYPKSQRFRLAKRIEDAAFDFHSLLIQATKEGHPRRTLLQADAELDKLRHYIRLAVDLGYTSPRQYGYVAEMLVEVGKLLGGWLDSLADQETKQRERKTRSRKATA